MGRCSFCHIPKTKGSGLTFHKFPKNRKRFQQWLANIPLEWKPNNDEVLCSRHFTDDCFDRTGINVRLKPNAAPTLFNHIQSFCVYCKRKKSYKSGISFFRFPINEPEILEQWCQKIGKENWKPTYDSYLCSTHFKPSCLKVSKGKLKGLKKGSIPTLFRKSADETLEEDDYLLAIESENYGLNDPLSSEEETNYDENLITSNLSFTVDGSGQLILNDDSVGSMVVSDDLEISVVNNHMLNETDPLEDVDSSEEQVCEPENIRLAAEHDHHYGHSSKDIQELLLESREKNRKYESIIISQSRTIHRLQSKIVSMAKVMEGLRQKLPVPQNEWQYSESTSHQTAFGFVKLGNENDISDHS